MLDCIVHFFETKFDPLDGVPVDKTAKWIAPLLDRVAFYETVLGLQILDVPTMIHDKEVSGFLSLCACVCVCVCVCVILRRARDCIVSSFWH